METMTVTCSVCIETFKATKDGAPIRHGFTSHNVRHGQTGGWQTGACGGMNFDHLGISTKGTEWAIRTLTHNIAADRAELARLGTNPDLDWVEMRQVGGAWGKKEVVATHTISVGTTYDSRSGRPDYASLMASRVRKVQAGLKAAEGARAALQVVVKEWTAAKYAPVMVAKKGPVLHKSTNWGKARAGQVYAVAACQKWAFHPTHARLATTDAEVTCTRCLKG